MPALRHCERPSSLALLFAFFQSVAVVSAFTNSFDAYPTNSQACLYDASSSSNCEGSDVTAMNDCLCSNGGGFVINSATCIGQSDSDDLETVYSVMASACAYSDTPLSVSQKEFMAAGEGTVSSSSSSAGTSTAAATSTTTAAPATSATSATSIISITAAVSTTSAPSGTSATESAASHTSTASATTITSVSDGHTVTITSTGSTATNTGGSSTNNSDPDGISSTSKIGIISGAAVAGVAIISVLIFFIIRMRRNKTSSDEQRPMLGRPPMGMNMGASPSGTELSHYAGYPGHPAPPGSTYDYKMHDGAMGSPVWVSTPTTPYPSTPSPAFHQGRFQPPQQPAPVFELSSEPPQSVVSEMPSTPMDRNSDPNDPPTETTHKPCGPADYKQPAL